MTKKAQIQLMVNCKDRDDWRKAHETIGKDGIFPKWWWKEIVDSGIAFEVASKFPKKG